MQAVAFRGRRAGQPLEFISTKSRRSVGNITDSGVDSAYCIEIGHVFTRMRLAWFPYEVVSWSGCDSGRAWRTWLSVLRKHVSTACDATMLQSHSSAQKTWKGKPCSARVSTPHQTCVVAH
jgi:hypothetical protein